MKTKAIIPRVVLAVVGVAVGILLGSQAGLRVILSINPGAVFIPGPLPVPKSILVPVRNDAFALAPFKHVRIGTKMHIGWREFTGCRRIWIGWHRRSCLMWVHRGGFVW